MCLAPRTLDDGTQVACRECWQCRKARVDDWCGRCIAEMKTTPVGVHTVSLTYGRGRDADSAYHGEVHHERAVVLTYSDVQKFLKLLRRHGYPCRYMVTGEYGSKNGRAHWHIVLFWLERVPPGIELEKNHWFGRLDEETGEHVLLQDGSPAWFWPHGHTYWKVGSYEAFRYNLKYVLKAQGQGADEAQSKAVMSKMPPMGAAYFADMGRRYAREGLTPQDGLYTFPEAVRKNGERVQFRLESGSASARLYADAFVAEWRERYASEPVLNEWLLTQLTGASERTREMRRLEDIEWRERMPDVAKPRLDELRVWMTRRSVMWNPDARCWEAPGREAGLRIRWQWINRKGAYGWRELRSE